LQDLVPEKANSKSSSKKTFESDQWKQMLQKHKEEKQLKNWKNIKKENKEYLKQVFIDLIHMAFF
jgi:hypothetical protein